jgi:hypothetical protein
VVTITGSYFTGATAVTFNGTAADFTVDSDTQIKASVPAGATTGKLSVTNTVGAVESAVDFILTTPPIIASFTPVSGSMATEVTITGSYFTGATAVTFNGIAAGFTIDSDTQIKATVPASATTGKIGVTNADGTVQSAANFIMMTPPTISSFTPTIGAEGTEVTITGSSFTGTTSIRFNGNEAASILIDSESQIRGRVPIGATFGTGKIVVTNAAGSTMSSNDFTITAAPVTFAFAPTHDAYVKSSSATKISNASSDGGAVYSVSNAYLGTTTPWIESGLIWNNAPSITGTALSSTGAVSVGQWVEFEVTPAITGNGTYSFGLKNNVSDVVYYRSKDDGSATAPQLIIQSLPSNAPSLTSFAPSSGPMGMEVTITGSKFTGATA